MRVCALCEYVCMNVWQTALEYVLPHLSHDADEELGAVLAEGGLHVVVHVEDVSVDAALDTVTVLQGGRGERGRRLLGREEMVSRAQCRVCRGGKHTGACGTHAYMHKHPPTAEPPTRRILSAHLHQHPPVDHR